MMPYKGYYWTILSPIIQGSIEKRYSKELAKKSIRLGKCKYKELLANADDIGKGNPMAMNAYFAYVFVGAWLGSDKEITPDGMALIMQDVLHKMEPFFATININSKKGSTYWYRQMKKYETWSKDNLEKYPTSWEVHFDENLHKDGSFYYFTRCPICTYMNQLGMGEIMGPLCSTDSLMFQMQHGVLHRDYTIAKGDSMCDYWVVGNQVKNPK